MWTLSMQYSGYGSLRCQWDKQEWEIYENYIMTSNGLQENVEPLGLWNVELGKNSLRRRGLWLAL